MINLNLAHPYQAEQEKREAAARGRAEASTKIVKVEEEPIPENVNRVVVEGEVARTVTEAIQILK